MNKQEKNAFNANTGLIYETLKGIGLRIDPALNNGHPIWQCTTHQITLEVLSCLMSKMMIKYLPLLRDSRDFWGIYQNQFFLDPSCCRKSNIRSLGLFWRPCHCYWLAAIDFVNHFYSKCFIPNIAGLIRKFIELFYSIRFNLPSDTLFPPSLYLQ